MTTHPRSRANLVLWTLFLGTFAVGCTEMLVVGVLDLVARGLDVSVPAAGTLVTANAFGIALGGPLLTALTIRHDRRTVLVAAITAFVAVMLLPVLWPNYALFVVARAVAGGLQGLILAAAFTIATSVVPPERAGRALSIVLSGNAVSMVVGVPIGTVIGHLLGWRGAFLVMLAIAVLVLVAALGAVPSTPGVAEGLGSQLRSAFAPRVVALLVLFVLIFAAVSSTLTYIIPFLEDVTGVSGAWVSIFLVVYGVATFIGSMVGGRFADGHAAQVLIVGSSAMALALLALYVVGSSAVLVALVVLVWGAFAFGMTPSMQFRAVSLAGTGGTLASSLPASAANAGVALGSLAGGFALDAIGIRSVALTGMVIAIGAAVVAVLTRPLRPPVTPEAAPARELVPA